MELSALEQIYREYELALAQAHKKAPIFAGLFGQGTLDDPRSASCNREFYVRTGEWVKEFAASGPTTQEALEVCRFLLEATGKRMNTPSYWYTLLAQDYIRELLPQLTQEDRCLLAEEMNRQYPKRRRLPFQEELYRQIKQE